MNFINSLYNTFLSLPTWARVLISFVAIAAVLIGFVEGLEAFGVIEFKDLTAEAAEAAEAAASS
jgi:hypothetical protein